MSETSERRGADRLRTNLEACWEGILARQTGTVVDISPTGCFILTRDDVLEKELIRLEVASPTGRTIYLWGEVAYRVEEMGFALHFTGTDPTEHEVFLLLIDYLRWAQKAEQEDSAPVSCHVS